ncbi:MAG: hypothetical protein LCH84_04805 [Gemmatimonadetes bacterium]|nr:hypothetical protein [Gemmatimonadota bacterium]
MYLANLLYDAGDMDGALRSFERTTPEDHWDDLGILRALELKRTVYRLADDDPELKPWEARLIDLAGEPDAVDELLAEVEQAVLEREHAEQQQAHGQLEQLGSLLNELQHTRPDDETAGALLDTLGAGAQMVDSTTHRIVLRDGQVFEGTWEAIVQALRDRHDAGRPLDEFMAREARRTYGATGQRVASHAPEAFIRGNADAGMWQLDR